MAGYTQILRPFALVRGGFYGWKLVALSLFVIFITSGPIWYGVGIWIKALELHFGWSRTQLTGAFSLAQLEGSILGPFVGYFVDRIGPRHMVFAGLVVIGIGFILFSRTTNLPMFYIAFATITFGSAIGTWLPMMAAINRWFSRRRSMAMAIAGEGSFLGGLVAAPLLAWAVTPGNMGWSAAALWIGILFLVVAWPASRFIRSRPEDYGLYVDGDSGPNAQQSLGRGGPGSGRAEGDQVQPDFTARQAIRTRAFWLITFGHALSTLLIATLTVHLVPMLTDQGMSLQTAAYVWSVVMAVGLVSQLVGGYVGDRIPLKLAIFGFTIFQTAGFIMAAFADNLQIALLFAVLYGIGFGGRVPLTTAIRGDYFGQRAFATITGISSVPMYGFMLAGPLIAAIMFDASGSYTLAFLILGGLGSLSGFLYLLAKKPVRAA